MTCEDANSKLVELVTVADIDDEDRVINNQQFVEGLVIKQNFCSDFEHKVCCLCFVDVMKLNLGRDSEARFDLCARFGQYLEF